MNAPAWLAFAWFASTVAVAPRALGAGVGFVACCTVASLVASRMLVKERPELLAALSRERALVHSGSLVIMAHVAATLLGGAHVESWAQVLRVTVVAAFAVLVRTLDPARARVAFAWAALALVCADAVLALGALAAGRSGAPFALIAPHQRTGTLPRFAGWSGTPGSAGAWALLAVGIGRHLPSRTARVGCTVTGCAVALASLSAATVALPAVLAAAVLPRGPARATIALLAGCAAVLVLWVNVLEVRVGDRRFEGAPLQVAHATQDLGPRFHPVQTSGVGPIAVDWHATAYALLAQGAVTCALRHPLAGVGPQRFDDACPVTTMNTYGNWSTHRRPHNQFTGWLVELGLLGVILGAVASIGAWRAYTWDPPDRWTDGAALGFAVAAFTGELLVTLPAAAFLALHLRRRHRDGG